MSEPKVLLREVSKHYATRGGAEVWAVRGITPVREPRHLLAPMVDPLLQGFGRSALVQYPTDADFRGVAADARHDAGNLSRRDRGEDDDLERIPRHACFFDHPCSD